jgi:hypothetical protein
MKGVSRKILRPRPKGAKKSFLLTDAGRITKTRKVKKKFNVEQSYNL